MEAEIFRIVIDAKITGTTNTKIHHIRNTEWSVSGICIIGFHATALVIAGPKCTGWPMMCNGKDMLQQHGIPTHRGACGDSNVDTLICWDLHIWFFFISAVMVSAGPKCTGYPKMYNGKRCASTTRYADYHKGACGCGNANGDTQFGWNHDHYVTAPNQMFFDEGNKGWCGQRCGKCIELTTTGEIWVELNCCLTSQATIFQLYVWRHIDVQATTGEMQFIEYLYSMERRFNIYSIIWRYLQIFEDIFKWIKDIFKSFEDIFNSFEDIFKWFEDIFKSFEDIFKWYYL